MIEKMPYADMALAATALEKPISLYQGTMTTVCADSEYVPKSIASSSSHRRQEWMASSSV